MTRHDYGTPGRGLSLATDRGGNLGLPNRPKTLAGIRHARSLLDYLHGADWVSVRWPAVTVQNLGMTGVAGTRDDGGISVSIRARWPHAVIVHEFGHELEARHLLEEAVDHVMRVIRSTETVETLTALCNAGSPEAVYLSMDLELFARAYAQWAATRGGAVGARVAAALRKSTGTHAASRYRQWPAHDFGATLKAFDDIFEGGAQA